MPQTFQNMEMRNGEIKIEETIDEVNCNFSSILIKDL